MHSGIVCALLLTVGNTQRGLFALKRDVSLCRELLLMIVNPHLPFKADLRSSSGSYFAEI